jgi:hypothetical protein
MPLQKEIWTVFAREQQAVFTFVHSNGDSEPRVTNDLVILWYHFVEHYADIDQHAGDPDDVMLYMYQRPVMLYRLVSRRYPVIIALVVFLGFAALILIAFAGYYAWNISVGLTGNDRTKLAELNSSTAFNHEV